MHVSVSDERALIARARQGDANAIEHLVREHQGVAFRVAYLTLGSTEDAADITQEAFVKALRALHTYDDGRPFRPWLLRIVTNEARNARKAAGRRGNLAVRYAEVWGWQNEAASPERMAIATERRERLLAALDTLEERHRLALSLRYFLELSEEEMALVLRCRRGTVKSRLSRAMTRLRSVIRERFPELEADHELET
jgi:RNA polymerase sigma-70 factor (ECF subfamily)